MSQLRFQTNIFFDTIMQMILMFLSLIFSLIWQFIYSNLIYFRYYPFTSHFICGSLQVFISKRKHILHVEKWMLQLHFQTARFIDTIMQIFLSFLSHIFSRFFQEFSNLYTTTSFTLFVVIYMRLFENGGTLYRLKNECCNYYFFLQYSWYPFQILQRRIFSLWNGRQISLPFVKPTWILPLVTMNSWFQGIFPFSKKIPVFTFMALVFTSGIIFRWPENCFSRSPTALSCASLFHY